MIVVIWGCVCVASCAQKGPPPTPAHEPPPPTAVKPAPGPMIPGAKPSVPGVSTPAPSSAARAEAQSLVRQAFDLLGQGEEEKARIQLERAVALDPENKQAACLLRGIKADPVATLGRESTSYTVRPGDSLSSIAKRALGDVCEFYILARYNQIRVPRQLAVGQSIRVPGRVPLSPPEPAPAASRPPVPEVAPPPPPPATAITTPEPSPPPPAPDDAAIRAQVERHHRIASEAFSRQDLDTAIKEWDKVLELDPGNDLARARREQAVALQRKLNELGK